MAWTKPTAYISAILVFAVVMTTLALVGDALNSNSRITLNTKSQAYVSQLTGATSDYGLDDLSETDYSTTADNSIIEGDENTTYSSTDQLAALNTEKERASKTISFFKIAYNIPTAMVASLGLDTTYFRHLFNIIGYILFVSILILIWTKVIRG